MLGLQVDCLRACCALISFDPRMFTLDRITIYPVKSLDGVVVDACDVLPCGALENDRRWRLVDRDGRVVNAKRTSRVHRIRAEYDLAGGSVTLSQRGAYPNDLCETFPLIPGAQGPGAWLSEALGRPVCLEERYDGGFPDDLEASGPTLVATASLAEVGSWFGIALEEARQRFRMNLEIGGCDAFWEDAVASPALALGLSDAAEATSPEPPSPGPRMFAFGSVKLQAERVCRRCPVPTRESFSGVVTERFREIFELRRSTSLRTDVDASQWGDLYRLGVNTRLVTTTAGSQSIHRGMPLGEA